MKVTNKNKIIITTGGTGGHIFPAYSLAKNFVKNNYLVEIITDKKGLKYLDTGFCKHRLQVFPTFPLFIFLNNR